MSDMREIPTQTLDKCDRERINHAFGVQSLAGKEQAFNKAWDCIVDMLIRTLAVPAELLTEDTDKGDPE